MKNDMVRLSIFSDYDKIVTISYNKRKLKKFIRKYENKKHGYNPLSIRSINVTIGFITYNLLKRNNTDRPYLKLRISYRSRTYTFGFTEEYNILKKYIKIKIKRGHDIEKLNSMEEIII